MSEQLAELNKLISGGSSLKPKTYYLRSTTSTPQIGDTFPVTITSVCLGVICTKGMSSLKLSAGSASSTGIYSVMKCNADGTFSALEATAGISAGAHTYNVADTEFVVFMFTAWSVNITISYT